jgi:hypothetical protein
MSFEQALRTYENYIEKGYYYKHLSVYYELFPPSNIRVVLFEEIKNSPGETIQKVYQFLKLKDAGFGPPTSGKKSNAARKPIFPFLNYALIRMKYFLREKRLVTLLHLVHATGIRKLAYYIRDKNTRVMEEYPAIDPRVRDDLRLLYREDIRKLEGLIQRNLEDWRR